MNAPTASPDKRADRGARRVRLGRILRRTAYVKATLLAVTAALVCAFYLRLVAGPVSLGDYTARIEAALEERLGPGWGVSIAETNLELLGSRPAVQVSSLAVRNPGGVTVVRSPHAVVSLDPAALVIGSVKLKEIELRSLQLQALIAADGTLSLSAQADAPVLPPPSAAPSPSGTSPLAQAVASLLDPVLRGTGLVGALDRATVSGARLSLVGPDGRERAAFPRLDARFERVDESERRLAIELQGANGSWGIQGSVRGGARREADLLATAVPFADVLLLSGMSGLQPVAGLKISGRLSVALDGDRLVRLDGQFESTGGEIRRAAQPPIRVDRASGRAAWDEARRVLALTDLELDSDGSRFRVGGEVTAGPAGWQFAMQGRDSLVAPLTAADPAIRIDELSAEISLDGGGVSLERGRIKGAELDISVSGGSVLDSEGQGLRARIEARGTNVRRLIRLWPDTLSPNLRRFLVENLRGGVVERMELAAALNSGDLRQALVDQPISDEALRLGFTVRDGGLTLSDGLPTLRGVGIVGRITGTKVELTSRGGVVEMGEGRRLTFSDGTYSQADYDAKDSVARIGFKVAGGADAFAAFLRSPLLREAGAPDIDPAGLKGRGEFRVVLPLAVHRVPAIAELPFTINGQFADVASDRLLPRERIEGGNLTLGYEAGTVTLKGEARISGSPAIVELSAGKTGGGTATVQLTLDEAARSRRSLPVAPQLSGPVQVKVVAALGGAAKQTPRVEADLSRAAIENLLPGWSKPAGRPGRLSFLLGDGEAPDLRDLVLEASPVLVKGHVQLGSAGGVDKADLPTFRLSPGDDLRVALERSGGVYKVALKGSNGDARPLIRQITGAPAGKGRDGPDVDLDADVAIVTGHGDEAMTRVAAKLALRKSDLRSLQLSGRMKGASVEAKLSKRDAGDPILTVDSTDAGATLRFLDIYRRMVGGRLALDARMGDAAQEGTVTVDGFALRGEPALKRLVSESVPAAGASEDRTGPALAINPNEVQFVKLSGAFRRNATKVEFRDVVIWGSQVGFNLAGMMDFARDRADISGTFVPAYALNNAFSQLPVIGLILGGGRNEGLFAVDFRITGPPASPTITVNPLSVVAPGILRKLFGWMLPEGEGAAETGSTQLRRPASPPR